MNKFTQTFVVPVAAISFFVGNANAKQIFDTPQDFHHDHEMTDQFGFVNIVPQQDGGVQNYVLRTGNLESTATFDGSNLFVNQGSTSTRTSALKPWILLTASTWASTIMHSTRRSDFR